MAGQALKLLRRYLMKIKSVILKMILSLFYPFSKLQKVHPDRITFISLEHDYLSKDFKLIYDQLQDKRFGKYEIKMALFKFEPSFLGNIKYGFACIRQLFLIQSSRLVILDFNNFVISNFQHKQDVKVLQLWHATGALKQFGNSVDRDYVIKNYDYSIVNSYFFKSIYAKAFNMYEDQIMVTGIPDNDKNFDSVVIKQNKARLLKEYPQLAHKKVITYAPTFRGRIGTEFKEVAIDLKQLRQELGDKYIIIYKPHPLISNSIYKDDPNVLFIEDESVSAIFSVTDLLVTDYSAITIDWMAFDKPTVAYVPDLDNYAHKPGLNINYETDFPGPVVRDENQLAGAIKSANSDADQKKRQQFTNKVYEFMDGKATQRVAEFVRSIVSPS